ncbi:hypothetical protein TrST_g10742 [Triparma strigata]|uniref:Palmitoyltransferase n=1 Tax=Triparma strigata TaxID=1606541 RepID=A0A9W7BQ21_9STRA|nr:hypothetical protein TrST_g10742 [Triparma strigata]
MRVNGMSAPLNGLQILTWFLFPYFLIGYTLLTFLPLLPNLSYNLPLAIAIYIAALAAVYNGYIACTVNPIDPLLLANLTAVPQVRSVGGPGKKFCWVCQVHVSTNSQHCRFCDKCVHSFDHHCAWLNTCVGSSNYHGTTFIAISLVYYGLLFGTVAMIAQLFFFHVNLKRLGISTYDYIIKEARENQKKQREKSEKCKLQREDARLRSEAGQRLLCGACWVGGEKVPNKGGKAKMAAVGHEEEDDHIDGKEEEEEEGGLEMTAITVKENEVGL